MNHLDVSKAILAYLFAFSLFNPIVASERIDFNKGWKFQLGDTTGITSQDFNDNNWRSLNLPHDWSIEGKFDAKSPATTGGGALTGGLGSYRKIFTIPESDKEKLIFIDFDGIYRCSEVWINGKKLGFRPNGYISIRYELTPYLNYGTCPNVIVVKVDNSKQPNSRWYSGSGIYRNVWLIKSDKLHIGHWGTFVTTPEVSDKSAKVIIKTLVENASGSNQKFELKSEVVDNKGNTTSLVTTSSELQKVSSKEIEQEVKVENPILWSVENPYVFSVISTITVNGKVVDTYETPLGLRYFSFDSEKGFLLNGKPFKINGVCNHHDLGCLGAAINTRAIERQLEILKEMGCNAIRTSHNPPAPELLSLCDRMGFLIMDEAFDMWKRRKSEFDYSLYWDEWHQRDLEDFIKRDRNHPSVIIWSIGNEILEQWDSTGTPIAIELTALVKKFDPTRPVTSGCNETKPSNYIIKSGALDLIGLNYHHQEFADFLKIYPNQKFIATETVSGLANRGSYDMPADTIRRWPFAWDKPFNEGNKDFSCSSYDNCSAPWGSTHEETWRIMKKYTHLSGQFIWTGFDYIGEPTPYPWPARSSYFGIIDLAGFPKDIYYMYQSEWTTKQVLHLLPHWNLPFGEKSNKIGDTIDVWAYTNQQEVELFLNGKSLGTRTKGIDDLHLAWKVPYEPGTLKAIGKIAGNEVAVKEVKTSGAPAKIILSADRNVIKADGYDLSFITVKVVDNEGYIVPNADNLIDFSVEGEGNIAGTDNGHQTDLESFKSNKRKAFHGMCLAIVQSYGSKGKITLTAHSEQLGKTSLQIESK